MDGIEFGITVVLTPEQIKALNEAGAGISELGCFAVDHLTVSLQTHAEEMGDTAFSLVSVGEVPLADGGCTPIRYSYWFKPAKDGAIYEGDGSQFLRNQGHEIDDATDIRRNVKYEVPTDADS